jgi:hypothetical protein
MTDEKPLYKYNSEWFEIKEISIQFSIVLSTNLKIRHMRGQTMSFFLNCGVLLLQYRKVYITAHKVSSAVGYIYDSIWEPTRLGLTAEGDGLGHGNVRRLIQPNSRRKTRELRIRK